MVSMVPLFAALLFCVSQASSGADMIGVDRDTKRTRAETAGKSKESAVKVRISIEGKIIHATLASNATARDFTSLLPLTLTLDDYAKTEKISYLPRKLSTVGAPAGTDPSVGDIAYYAPWGNLVIYYRDFGYSAGLIHLGRIDSGGDLLDVPGSLNASIEAVPE